MDELNLEYEKMIYGVINQKFYFCHNKEDLFQVGYIGLCKALNKFNENMGVKFYSYAYKWIYGEIYKYLNYDKTIKQSKETTMLYLKIMKVATILSQKMMREPTNLEIAEYLGVDLYLVEEAIIGAEVVTEIDDTKAKYEEDIIDKLALKEELSKLSVEEMSIIEKRYMCDLTQQQTAESLGMSQVQVSRKEQKIISKLKNHLTAKV